MRDISKKGLSKMRGLSNGSSPSRIVRGKQIYKTMNNIKITLLCGFITILVLRGTIGLSGFTSWSHDANDPSQDLVVDEHGRTLSEINADQSEQEEDDLEPEIDLNSTFTLGPKISDWNEQRNAWMQENPEFTTLVNGKPKILLVTGSPPKPCDNPAGDHYLLKAIKNKIDYCRIHNIEIFYNLAHLQSEMAGYWSKLPLIHTLMLTHPEFEWIWWMDSDTMLTDMVFELPLDKYKEFNFILHGWELEIYGKRNWVGLNTGSFLLRNCQWSLDMLDAWAPMGPKGKVREEAGKLLSETLEGRPAFEADDQSALIHLLITQRNVWEDKVYLENSYFLHGFWVKLVEKFEEMMEKHHPGHGDERWPFVTHFVGCKACSSYGDYSVERCLKQMERAFNFGDNQILQMYGFEHRYLDTFKVRRTRNDTDAPIDLQDGLNLLLPAVTSATF